MAREVGKKFDGVGEGWGEQSIEKNKDVLKKKRKRNEGGYGRFKNSHRERGGGATEGVGERGGTGDRCGARLMSKEHHLTSHGWWRWVLRPLLTPWVASAGGKRAEFHLPCGACGGDWWKIAGHAAQFGVAHRTFLA